MKNTVYIIISGDRTICFNKAFWSLEDAQKQLDLERYVEWYITEIEVE